MPSPLPTTPRAASAASPRSRAEPGQLQRHEAKPGFSLPVWGLVVVAGQTSCRWVSARIDMRGTWVSVQARR